MTNKLHSYGVSNIFITYNNIQIHNSNQGKIGTINFEFGIVKKEMEKHLTLKINLNRKRDDKETQHSLFQNKE